MIYGGFKEFQRKKRRIIILFIYLFLLKKSQDFVLFGTS